MTPIHTETIRGNGVALTNLTPEPGHFMFGYYDRCPWNAGDQLHLALHIPQQDHLPLPGESASVGYIDRATRTFHAVAKTRAWCHQQGAMTLWHPRLKDTFLFNDYNENEKKLCARLFEINGHEIGRIDRPLYSISHNGRWGSSLDFGRIPRRGYSYADVPLSNESDRPDLDNDGIFMINLADGKETLIVPYRKFLEAHPFPYTLEKSYWYLNHIVFNCDDSRIMVLCEQVRSKSGPPGGQTNLFTMNIDGSNFCCPLPTPYWHDSERTPDRISHQLWGRTPREIIIDPNWFGDGNACVVFDESKRSMQAHRISDGFGVHAHFVFSPDGKWIACDTYPDKNNIERLGVIEVATGTVTELGRFRHISESPFDDLRCDLHPRWSHDGTIITVDSIHSGERKIYLIDVGDIVLRKQVVAGCFG
ncbi:MAG: hypothetical protein NT011_08925 [Kiritimatiellaeota bacterium]|nr:hypothetical protein [Kiritimatiellota bacterium]